MKRMPEVFQLFAHKIFRLVFQKVRVNAKYSFYYFKCELQAVKNWLPDVTKNISRKLSNIWRGDKSWDWEITTVNSNVRACQGYYILMATITLSNTKNLQRLTQVKVKWSTTSYPFTLSYLSATPKVEYYSCGAKQTFVRVNERGVHKSSSRVMESRWEELKKLGLVPVWELPGSEKRARQREPLSSLVNRMKWSPLSRPCFVIWRSKVASTSPRKLANSPFLEHTCSILL